jgi:GGDEF domain-containing protein
MIAAMHDRPAPGRPRPLADPVVGALADRSDDVARRWLVALLEGRSLEESATLPLAELAASGPPLCRAALEAVGSDAALDALAAEAEPGRGDARAADPAGGHAALLARLSGPAGGPAIVAAAEALRRAVSAAAADELPRSDTDVLASLTDRLAHVCARLAAAAMAQGSIHRPDVTGQAPPAEASPHGPEASSHRPRAGEPPPAPLAGPASPPGTAPLWLAALERQLAQGGRFGLLLIELDGADRIWLSEGEEAARDLFGRTGRAVRAALRRSDLLAHEQDGRLWVIAPGAGRPSATALGSRVADAIEGAASARGVPLTATVGLALYPDDGRDVEALTAHAEESALAARAQGVRMAGEPDDRPAAQGPRLVH